MYSLGLVLDPRDIRQLLEVIGTYTRGEASAGNDHELGLRRHVLDRGDL